MTVDDMLVLAVIVAVAIVVLAAVYVRRLRGVSPTAARQILLAVTLYVLHGAVGIAILIYLRPVLSNGPVAAVGAMMALLGWFGFGAHVLFWLTPSTEGKPKPRWMLQLGVFDLACLAAVAAGMTMAAGLI